MSKNLETVYLLTNGIISVLQKVECTNCKTNFNAFLIMSFVDNDKLLEDACPVCFELTLEVITFKKEERC